MITEAGTSVRRFHTSLLCFKRTNSYFKPAPKVAGFKTVPCLVVVLVVVVVCQLNTFDKTEGFKDEFDDDLMPKTFLLTL